MTLVRSKHRVADHVEVFTPAWMVEAMLGMLKGETERIDSRFLELACGSGRTSIVQSRAETFTGKIGELTVRLFVVPDMSVNDPYLSLDARNQAEVIVVVNQVHPHWSQLKGSEGVLNYLRHCLYDGIAEWQSWSKASRLDTSTIRLLKDALLRIPLEMEKHGSNGST